jgi:endonuclease/exonuclease/phosphatase family metal-dependent hydrolase
VYTVYCIYVGCLTPYITPSSWSYITFFALGFPFLLLGMLLWLIVTIIFYRKRSWIFLLVFLAGFKNIQSTIGFHFSTNFVQQKQPNSIRVLNWNVQDFIDSQIYTDTPGNKRREIMAFIQKMDADIVCLQDFQEHTSIHFRSCLKDISQQYNYPYHYFCVDQSLQQYYAFIQYGTVIFSRYPIVDSGSMAYKINNIAESLSYVDIVKEKDTIRVFNTHLRSMYIKANMLDSTLNFDLIGKKEIEFLTNNPSKFTRLQHYAKEHITQAKFIKEQLNKSKYPIIFCADLNSVPTSYVYHTIKNGLTDAFIAKGFGIGATYYDLAPTLRIDVILTSKKFKTLQCYIPTIKASDHYPVVADLKIK